MSRLLQLKHEDYTVGWICALPDPALTAAYFMLDEKHQRLEKKDNDPNVYQLGRIDEHNIVIVCLGNGVYGTPEATNVASNLIRSFPNVKIGLMVGIGGGAPRLKGDGEIWDLRLGDVVVATASRTHGGVISYNAGKRTIDPDLELKGYLDGTPQILRNAIGVLRAVDKGRTRKERASQGFSRHLESEAIKKNEEFQYPGQELDCLYDGDTDAKAKRNRPLRTYNYSIAFYGTIGSAHIVMKNAEERDHLRDKYDIMCFETEAAGLMNYFPCAVIRGIANYADSHKNKKWQAYAALTAAAYAKELLTIIPPDEVKAEKTASATAILQSEKVMDPGDLSENSIGPYGTRSISDSSFTIPKEAHTTTRGRKTLEYKMA